MRLPSVDRVLTSARETAARFPLVLLSGLVAAVGGIGTIDAGDDSVWLRLLVAGSLGLPLLFAAAVWAERAGRPARARALAGGLGIAILAAIFFIWPSWSDPVATTRYFQLSAGFHLLAAVLPFARRDEPNGFWQYNRILFLRFLEAAVYAGVLFLGLALALGALDQLFGVEVPGETYGRMWFVVALVFHPWLLLAGIPSDLGALERRTDYPGALKVFAQFILIPLVTVYLAILTAYLVKVVSTQEWPSGWIGYLVSGVAVAGILALLLVHPVRERAENRWVATYARGFWIALLPAAIMLLMAIGKRIDQYGVTANRYIIAVLGVWLAAMALFYAITRSRNIQLIPASLCLLAFVTFLGPWSAYAVAQRSQLSRLEGLLRRNGLLVDGRIRPAGGPAPAPSAGPPADAAEPAAGERATAGNVSFEDRRQISAVITWLAERYGTEAIDPWFEGRLAAIDTVARGTGPGEPHRAPERARLIAAELGIEYVPVWVGGPDAAGRFVYRARDPLLDTGPVPGTHASRGESRPEGGGGQRAFDIRGYDYTFTVAMADRPGDPGLKADTVRAGSRRLVLTYDDAAETLRIRRNGALLIELPLTSVLDTARESATSWRGTPPEGEPPSVRAANARVRAMLYPTLLMYEAPAEDGTRMITALEARILLAFPAGAEPAPAQDTAHETGRTLTPDP